MLHHPSETIGDRIDCSIDTLRKDVYALKFLPPASVDSSFIATLDKLEPLLTELLQWPAEDRESPEIERISDVVNRKIQFYLSLEGHKAERNGFRKLLDAYQHIEWKYNGYSSVILKGENISGQEVAIKIPRSNHPLSDSIFISEVEAAGMLKTIVPHDNLVSFITETADPYRALIMEWIPGVTISEYWELNGYDIEFGQAIRLMLGITKALRSTHKLGRVHLDIRPQNIIFRGYEPDSPPVLIDWGLSGVIRSSGGLTSPVYDQDRRPRISPEYAAPEQLSKNFGLPSQKTDVYRLGLIFHDLLCDSGDDPARFRKNQKSALGFEPSPIEGPPSLVRLLHSSLQKQVSERCTLEEFGKELSDMTGTTW